MGKKSRVPSQISAMGAAPGMAGKSRPMPPNPGMGGKSRPMPSSGKAQPMPGMGGRPMPPGDMSQMPALPAKTGKSRQMPQPMNMGSRATQIAQMLRNRGQGV